MRRLSALLTASLLTWLLRCPLRAELPQTPYSAVVVEDEVLVRSGPGKESYYPTGKLKRGDRVTVRRHDPGGWFMIDPPPGSFSWIDTQFVRRESGNQGVVTENNFVRIGTEFGHPSGWIRHLVPAGTRVEILGEATIQTERGPIRAYKIKPPLGEYRWIPGAAIVPIDEDGKVAGNTAILDGLPENLTASPSNKRARVSNGPKQAEPTFSGEGEPMDRTRSAVESKSPASGASSLAAGLPNRGSPPDSLASSKTLPPSAPRSSAPEYHPSRGPQWNGRSGGEAQQNTGLRSRELLERPLVRITDDGVRTEPTDAQRRLEQQRRRLEELDEQFRQMVRRNISEWDLTGLEHGYKSLAAEVDDPSLAYQLKLRLEAVERYKRKKHAYDEFVRLTEETSRRDAQLLALERQVRSRGATAGPVRWNPPADLTQRQTVDAKSWRQLGPRTQTSRDFESGATPSQMKDQQIHAVEPVRSRPSRSWNVGSIHLDGAGIVQRVSNPPRGAPPYALVAPDGRLLTYLQPGPNVDLEQYVGQAVGIIGPRYHRSDLGADYAIVRRLVPVRLKP